MTPEIAIRELLKNTSVGGRIYTPYGTFDEIYPLVIQQRVMSQHYHVMSGVSPNKFSSANVQLTIYGQGYDTARTVAAEIRDVLNGYNGSVTLGDQTMNIQHIRLANDLDGFDMPDRGRNTGIASVIQEYFVTYLDTLLNYLRGHYGRWIRVNRNIWDVGVFYESNIDRRSGCQPGRGG